MSLNNAVSRFNLLWTRCDYYYEAVFARRPTGLTWMRAAKKSVLYSVPRRNEIERTRKKWIGIGRRQGEVERHGNRGIDVVVMTTNQLTEQQQQQQQQKSRHLLYVFDFTAKSMINVMQSLQWRWFTLGLYNRQRANRWQLSYSEAAGNSAE